MRYNVVRCYATVQVSENGACNQTLFDEEVLHGVNVNTLSPLLYSVRYNSEISTKKWNCSSVMFYFPCRRLCLCDEHELRDDGLHWIDNQLYANGE